MGLDVLYVEAFENINKVYFTSVAVHLVSYT